MTAHSLRRLLPTLVAAAALAFFALIGGGRADAATCYAATGAATNPICWLDLTSASVAIGGSTAISWTLPDGSTLSGTITNAGLVAPSPGADSIPTYSGSALGTTAYTGVSGKPAIYGSGTFSFRLSNVKITDPQGNAVANATIAAADAETLDTGDGTALTANITWATTGTSWAELQLMNSVSSNAGTPICTLSGLGTQNARCVPSSGGNNAAYILGSAITSAQTVTLSTTTTAYQGFAFGLALSTIQLKKNVTSRIASGDEFSIAISRNGVTSATATTTGTTTGTGQAATSTVTAIPGQTYTLSESAAGTTALGLYSSTYACTNANTASTTTSPSGSGTSFTLAPAVDDQFTCAFTNTALTSTDVPTNPAKAIAAGATITDNFVLTNTSAVAAYFTGASAPTVTTSTGATITPTGYTFNGTTYASVQALFAALDASTTAAGGSATIGIQYVAPTTIGQTVTLSVNSQVTANGGTSSLVTATEVDTVEPSGLSVQKTGTTATSPGGLIAYNILVSNTTASAANNAVFRDPLPAGLIIEGTPACTLPTGGAVCPTIAVSGNTVTGTIATFPSMSSLTLTINAAAGTATSTVTSYTNTATITPTSGTAASGSLTTSVAQANGISKTVQNLTTGTAIGVSDSALPGNELRYTLAFKNTTGATIVDVVLSDPLPAAVTYYAANCGTLPSGVTCTYTSPAVGKTGTVVFTYTGQLPAGGVLNATIDAYVI